ncbi:MAG: CRISPR-associated endonuclease Cas2 [Candidatus Moraniibacteriota bacterium]
MHCREYAHENINQHQNKEGMAVGRNTRVDVQHILLTAAGEGVFSMEVLVANVLKTLTALKKDDRRYRSSYYVQNAITKLEQNGLLGLNKKEGSSFVRLTEKGDRELAQYATESAALKPQKWDGKWRLVIFDIKETKKGKRDRVRRNLVRFGFEKLQNSVWVYPYECEDLIALLKADCKIDKEVLYMVSEKIQDDGWIKKKFGLSI